MLTYPNGAKYIPEKAEFAIFIAGDRLVLALRSDKVLSGPNDLPEYFEPITSFFSGGPNQPKTKISGRHAAPKHFVIPSLIARKIVIGEVEAIETYNKLLVDLIAAKKFYEESLQALVRGEGLDTSKLASLTFSPA